jgi:stearoyl-CoA desaturase (delta-9 desaturase)
LIAAVTFGEGWHNNHHAYPRSAGHGLRWYEFDINWIQIWAFGKLGLAKDIYAYELAVETPESANGSDRTYSDPRDNLIYRS